MSHPRNIALTGTGLLLAAVAVWARDLRWTQTLADTLPLALGLPLAYGLGRPWRPAPKALASGQRWLAILAALAFAIGWVVGSVTTLAIAWTLAALVWSAWAFTVNPIRPRLGWIALLSFPWLVIEWQSLGWAFRLSSAAVAQRFFELLMIPVVRDGTSIKVMGVPIEIEAACAGWNLLQLTFLAGVCFGVYEIRSNRRFHLLLCLLPFVVWIANLLRILILSGIALSFDTEVASGAIHGLTGLVVLAAVIAMTKGLCVLLEPVRRTLSTRVVKAP